MASSGGAWRTAEERRWNRAVVAGGVLEGRPQGWMFGGTVGRWRKPLRGRGDGRRPDVAMRREKQGRAEDLGERERTK